jgi:hypothetical protein
LGTSWANLLRLGFIGAMLGLVSGDEHFWTT